MKTIEKLFLVLILLVFTMNPVFSDNTKVTENITGQEILDLIVSDNIIFLSTQEGIEILKLDDDFSIIPISTIKKIGQSNLILEDNLLFEFGNIFNIHDISNLEKPVEVYSSNKIKGFDGLLLESKLYCTDQRGGIHIYDIKDIERINEIDFLKSSGERQLLHLNDDILYLSSVSFYVEREAGIRLFSISQNTFLEYTIEESALCCSTFNDYLILGNLWYLNLYKKNAHYEYKLLDTVDAGVALKIIIYNGFILVANYDLGLTIWTIKDEKLNFVKSYLTGEQVHNIYIKDELLFVSFGENPKNNDVGFAVYELEDISDLELKNTYLWKYNE